MMTDSEEEKALIENFLKNVKWLREHVAPDDIYDFAQQMIVGAEYLILKLSEQTNLDQEILQDKILYQWVNNIYTLRKLKMDGFSGILDVGWKVGKK